VVTPLEIVTSSNPVDMGWVAVRTHCAFRAVGNSRLGSTGLVREVTVKVYGVAVTMPQG
jgi:hypothetical protein